MILGTKEMMAQNILGLMKHGHHIKTVAIMEGNIQNKVDLQLMAQGLTARATNKYF